jgi:hypothetical protein
MVRPPQRRFHPVGRCIYCGASDRPLGREHIIPYGLDGDLILPSASCGDCAAITSKFERICLRGFLQGPRHLLDVTSRRGAPTKLPLLGDHGITPLPFDKAPIILMMPVYDLPTALGGPALGQERKSAVWVMPLRLVASDLSSYGGSVGTQPLHQPSFCRMLAKIAHSMAVAEIGLGRFHPHLLEIIYGRDEQPHQLIGGLLERRAPTRHRHEITTMVHEIGNSELIVAEIRLFADLGAPTYVVVVGEQSSS